MTRVRVISRRATFDRQTRENILRVSIDPGGGMRGSSRNFHDALWHRLRPGRRERGKKGYNFEEEDAYGKYDRRGRFLITRRHYKLTVNWMKRDIPRVFEII